MTTISKTGIIGQVRKDYPYLLAIAFFIVFKVLYPKPDLFWDSVNYIHWGFEGYELAFRPLGYTHFMMLFNGWGGNYFTIVVIQFIVFLASSYLFLETLFALFHPSRPMKWFCWLAVIYNPLSYYILNLISPDSFFINLSALWLAALLRFLFFDKHRYVYLAIHIVCFFLLFWLRYNALYYPFFAVVVILLCHIKRPFKIAGIVANIAIFTLLYIVSINKAQRVMNISALSGFGGWVMANNAIHIYGVTTVDSSIFEEPEELLLHRFVLAFKDSAYRYDKATAPSDQYMWSQKGPLKRHQVIDELRGGYVTHLESWWGQAHLYNSFGLDLIKHYPGAFINAFYWPNFKSFFYPNPEVLTHYNFQKQELAPDWMQYLGLHGKNVLTSPYTHLQKITIAAIVGIYAVLTPICMLFSIMIVILYLLAAIRNNFKVNDMRLSAALVLSFFYLLSTVLLVFAHPVLLRYISLLLIFISIMPFLAYKVLMERRTVQ